MRALPCPSPCLEESRMERGEEENKRARPCGLALFAYRVNFCLLKRHQRQPSGSRKIIVRKPTSRLKHIGRYFMPRREMRQETKIGLPIYEDGQLDFVY